MKKQPFIGQDLEHWLKILSVTIISLVAFEAIAVSTAMPYVVDIIGGEHLYALASGIALAGQLISTALSGLWADARGPKPALYAGLAVFCAGLLTAAAAPNIYVLIIGRAVQGFGGGLMIVALYVLVGNNVAPQRQPAFFAAFAAAWVIPSFIGPVVAGFFVEHVNWRWVFGITPLLLAPLMPVLAAKLGQINDIERERGPLVLGRTFWWATSAGIAAAGLQILSGVERKDFSAGFVVAIAMVTVAAVVFVRPLLPKGTFVARRGLPSVILLRGIVNGSMIATEIYLPLMLKNVHGWGPTEAGLVMTISSITWAIGSWVQGRAKTENFRRAIPTLGTAILLVGILLAMLPLIPRVPGIFVLGAWLLAGFGTGMVYPAMTVLGLALTPRERHGETSSALQIADAMGAAACVAYAGIAYAIFTGHIAFVAAISTMAIIGLSGVAISGRTR